MADEVKLRTLPLSPLPNDEAFTPGGVPSHEHDHGLEEEFAENLMYENNTYKVQHYRGAAQLMANDLGCAVLLHYYALPGFQHTNPTMMAALIPGETGLVTAPPPASRSSKW